MQRNNKFTIFFLFLAIVAFVLFVVRLSYLSIEYRKDSQYVTNVTLLERFDELLLLLEKESISSAVYLGKQNEKYFNDIQMSRNLSDEKISILSKILSDKDGYQDLKNSLQTIEQTLAQVRLEVNSFTQDYKRVLIEEYNNKIIYQTSESIQRLIANFSSEQNANLNKYYELTKMKENLYSE
ncbi:MAG TPA: hypothetical protein ENK95_02820, partial [Campylobacterales bacterium]|nr:hypothetical protein [Campylobacterales bacterium]